MDWKLQGTMYFTICHLYKKYWGYAQHKGLVALTEYQQVGWRLIKEENCDNKNYKRHT